MTQWFAKDHSALLNKYKDSRESSIDSVRDALQSHKAVYANPLGFVRTDCFESTALLSAVDGALKTKLWSAVIFADHGLD